MGNWREDLLATATLRWSPPVEAVELGRRMVRHELIIMAIRGTALTALSLFVLYSLLQSYTKTLPWDWFLLILPGMALFQFLLPVLASYLPAAKRPKEYSIVSEGIYIHGAEHPLQRWNFLDSYTTVPHETLSGVTVLWLHRKDGFVKLFDLATDDEITHRVLEDIAKHLPQRPPLAKHTGLSRRDWAVGFALAIGFAIGVVALLNPNFDRIRGHGGEWLLQLLFAIGPGTILAPFLWRRRAAWQVFMMGLMLNVFGGLGGMSAAILWNVTHRG